VNWRSACIWSSWALLPMTAILAAKGSLLAALYGLAAAVAFAYHWCEQKRWSAADHALAWACIGANCWLAWRSPWEPVAVALLAIAHALVSYRKAHQGDYDRHHTHWHLWCGLAGVLLAAGYKGVA
jgi:hypothetical protein